MKRSESLSPKSQPVTTLRSKKTQPIELRPAPYDDNSITQFALLALWVARKHGVPVEDALERIEKRFLFTQNPQNGGWPYSGQIGNGSPSMTCAGLLGLSTAVARREERLIAAPVRKVEPKSPTKSDRKSDDPFFDPPPRPAPKAVPTQIRELARRAQTDALARLYRLGHGSATC